MRAADAHLTPQELELLLFGAADSINREAIGAPAPEAQQHLSGCAVCQAVVERYRNAENALTNLEPGNNATNRGQAPTRQHDCPAEATWLSLAAGLLDEDETARHVAHAATCDWCGPLLKEAMQDLAQHVTQEEQEALAQLPTGSADWQREMAKKLAGRSRSRYTATETATVPAEKKEEIAQQKPRAAFQWWPRLAWAVAVVALVPVAWFVWLKTRAPDVNQLLAQAYTERRSMELRIAGARFAGVRLQRGGEQSLVNRPASLMKAEELIAINLTAHPSDPHWLQAKARADMLDGNSDSAIRSLQRGLEIQPDSSSLLTDLASAYYQRDDYDRAVELLGRALANAPDDPIALFNRAIVSERAFLYAQAEDDWEHYLRIDKTGAWADDARQRLAALREKLKKHQQAVTEPLYSPSQLAAGLEDRAVVDLVDRRIEEYLRVALIDWLPKAYPLDSTYAPEISKYQAALHTLAQIARQEHGDSWLQDLLASTSSRGIPLALRELSAAFQANDSGDNLAARQHAFAAVRLFAVAGNHAGLLRARVEYLFAAHDAQEGVPCLQAARALRGRLETGSYRWLTAQFHIEEGTCFWLMGQLGEAQELYRRAGREAEASNYNEIYMRAQDHLAGVSIAAGKLSAAWAMSQQALARYWSGRYPSMRGYNLYYNLYEFSRLSKQPHLQIAVWRDALVFSESFSDNILRAMAHSAMANAAVAAQQPQVAEKEFDRAGQLFAAAPQIKSTRIDFIEAVTRLAGVEAAQGKSREAVERLRQLEPEVAGLSDNFLAILFYTTLGDAQSHAGNTQQADAALRSAIRFAEIELQSLRDGRSRVEWAQQSSSAYRNAVQQRLRQGDSQGALEVWEWYRGAALRSRNAPGQAYSGRGSSTPVVESQGLLPIADGPTWPEPHQVTAELPTLARETIVAYAVLPEGLGIWVYDNRGVFAHWMEGNPRDLMAKARWFRELSSDPTSEEADRWSAARGLYNILIAPVEPQLLRGRTLVIEADEGLAGIPFHALIDSQNRFLGERAPLVSSLGLYYRGDLRRSTPIARDATTLIAAVSASAADIDPTAATTLPDTITEGETVADIFPLSRILRGKQATIASTLSYLQGTQVFHFAGHAITVAHETGLLMSDGLLQASALKDRQLSSMQLAVLSACDTQDGSAGALYDPDALVGTFLRAGVPHVVASGWNVDTAATRQFMELFYRALLSGSSVPESIQLAQARLRAQPGMTHPYYWSAFTAFGTP